MKHCIIRVSYVVESSYCLPLCCKHIRTHTHTHTCCHDTGIWSQDAIVLHHWLCIAALLCFEKEKTVLDVEGVFAMMQLSAVKVFHCLALQSETCIQILVQKICPANAHNIHAMYMCATCARLHASLFCSFYSSAFKSCTLLTSCEDSFPILSHKCTHIHTRRCIQQDEAMLQSMNGS